MAFDLDDDELKATREMLCNKIRYNYKLELKKEVSKAIIIIKEIFMKQARRNQRTELWFEINNEDTQILMAAINILINAYERDEKIIDRMLDSFIGLDSDIEIVRQHARINSQEKKADMLKSFENEILK